MAIILLLYSYIGIFSLYTLLSTKGNRAIIIETTIIFSFLVWLLTESLSLFTLFNYTSLVCCWGIISILISYLNYSAFSKKKVKASYFELSNYFKTLASFEKKILFFLGFIISILFLQGVLYPPNNWDSLNYHMSRLIYWVSNESVAHFPAYDYRQVLLTPFAEYFFAHICILFKSDLLANSVQLLFLLLSAITSSLLVKDFGFSKKYQLITAFFVFTIPQVVIQASSTKNDIIVAFFILATLRYVLLVINEKRNLLENAIIIGLLAGFGMLTKATGYLYLFPILLYWAYWLIAKAIKEKQITYLKFGIVAVTLLLIINAFHFNRNFNLTGNILGAEKRLNSEVSNEKMSAKLLFSNISRNMALHLAPFPLSKISNWGIEKIHQVSGIDINDSQTTFPHTKFKVTNYPNGEGDAPNVLHFLLGLTVFLFLISKKSIYQENPIFYIIGGIIIVQFLFFCFYLKWQPWHTRLHTSMFISLSPLLAFFLQKKYSDSLLEKLLLLAFAAYTIGIIVINNPRPLIKIPNVTSDISINEERFDKFFVALPKLKEDYKKVQKIIQTQQPKVILVQNQVNIEYAIFSNIFNQGYKVFNSTKVDNVTKNCSSLVPQKIDLIITNKDEKDNFILNKKSYQKIESPITQLNIYKPKIKNSSLGKQAE